MGQSQRKELPDSQNRPLSYAENAVVEACLKLPNQSQSAVARYMGLSSPTVWQHLQKPRVKNELVSKQTQASDKARDQITRFQRMLAKSAGLVDAALGRPCCDHCKNLPISIMELGSVAKLSLDGLKSLLELRDTHGLGQIQPGDPQQQLQERSIDRARVMQLARAIKGSYKSRIRAWYRPRR